VSEEFWERCWRALGPRNAPSQKVGHVKNDRTRDAVPGRVPRTFENWLRDRKAKWIHVDLRAGMVPRLLSLDETAGRDQEIFLEVPARARRAP